MAELPHISVRVRNRRTWGAVLAADLLLRSARWLLLWWARGYRVNVPGRGWEPLCDWSVEGEVTIQAGELLPGGGR